jgi:hypothetical protein
MVFVRRSLALVVIVFGWVTVSLAQAQVQPAATQQASPESPASSVDASATKESTEQKPVKARKGAFVAVPVPTSSPATGSGVTLMAGYIFPISKDDKVSPPSIVGGAGLITNNGTRALAIGTELYFKQDRYHVLTGFAHGDLNYDFYGTGTVAGNAGLKFGLNQTGNVFFGEALRRIFWRVFVGPRFWFGSSTLAPQHLGENRPDLPPLDVAFDMRAMGFKIERDTVPNRFYPVSGTTLTFGSDFFSKGLGGTFTFQTYRLKFNAYHSFDAKQVLAYNAFVCSTGGNAPFFGQCIFGMQDELRGYPAGRYIDKKMIATQLEYRLVLPWRLGMVAFAGLGEVAPNFSSFNGQNLLGSVGGGARFNLSTKYHVNLRADIAQGKNESTFSMGLGEAF